MRSKIQQQLAEIQAQHATVLIAEAARSLDSEQVPYRGLFKQGELVFAILDTAEELDCHEIVLPLPQVGWRALISRNNVRRIKQRQRTIPIITVGADGLPDQTWEQTNMWLHRLI